MTANGPVQETHERCVMDWLFLLPVVGAGLAVGWMSYRCRWEPLLRSLEKHLREESDARQAHRRKTTASVEPDEPWPRQSKRPMADLKGLEQ